MNNLKFDFTNKSAVITGGAAGIGFEITKRFVEAGAKVAVWDYSDEALEMARKELASAGERVQFSKVNVGDRSSCEAAASKLPWAVDIVVNNAGITRDKSFAKMSDEDFDAVIQTNLTGLFNVTKNLLSRFAETEHRRIINISSIVGLFGNFGQTNYAAAKAGVIGMTKTWARELGRKGFTSNAIAPGFIHTAMVDAMPKEVVESMAAKVPAQRLGRTGDIASTCLFLASEEASYINGAVISVDGGLVI